jgi:hypothetical protein
MTDTSRRKPDEATATATSTCPHGDARGARVPHRSGMEAARRARRRRDDDEERKQAFERSSSRRPAGCCQLRGAPHRCDREARASKHRMDISSEVRLLRQMQQQGKEVRHLEQRLC